MTIYILDLLICTASELFLKTGFFLNYKLSVSVNVWPALTAIFGNCLVLFVFWRRSLYKRPVNWFIVNLAVADLSVSLFAHPMSAVAAFNQRYENQLTS